MLKENLRNYLSDNKKFNGIIKGRQSYFNVWKVGVRGYFCDKQSAFEKNTVWENLAI